MLVTTYLQDVLGHPPATAGLLFLPFSIVVALGSLLGTAAGVAAFGLIASARTASSAVDGARALVDGFQLAWLLAAALAITAAILGRSAPPKTE